MMTFNFFGTLNVFFFKDPDSVSLLVNISGCLVTQRDCLSVHSTRDSSTLGVCLLS